MKRLRVNDGKIALVFKNGNYQRALTAGVHWITPFEKEWVYDLAQPFEPPVELSLLIKDEQLKQHLTVVEVADNELVIRYEEGRFVDLLTPGKYAFWKGVRDFSFQTIDLGEVEVPANFDLFTLRKAAFAPYVRVCKIASHEKGVLFVDNKAVRTLEPGDYYFWKNAKEVAVSRADLRRQQLEVSGQEILTKDKATLRVNFYVHFLVTDIYKALVDNKDFEKQLYVLVQLALRSFIGGLTLDGLLESKEGIAEYVMQTLEGKAEKLGVEIADCGVKDLILPGDMKEIMNQVLIAEKQAQANVISRREETASTRSLLNTAKLLEENNMLLKLKEMEYVEKIADKVGEITLGGNGQLLDQLKGLFTTGK